jgi:hypothetical protein
MKKAILAATIALLAASSSRAAIIISEVSAYGSGNTTYAADWFELTNTGAAAVNIAGWKVDDSSNAFATAVALRGVTSIGAGQSVIFFEGNASGSTDATITTNFINAWFGGTAPAGFSIGAYGGSGVGLNTGGDGVSVFNGAGTLITSVTFDASTTGRTFDNAAGLNGAISQLSAVGVNGAFNSVLALSSGAPPGTLDIGSPGAVPEPGTALLILAGLGLMGAHGRRRANR